MALALYPRSSYDAFHGTQLQFPPHVDQAVQQIYGACKGLGTDEQTLIAVLGSKSPETRTLIALRYQELYKKPLKDLVKSETSGDFGRLLRMLSTPLHETEAQLLRDATKGMGTNENQIVQIISGRTNEEMDILKKTYFRLFNKDLAVTLNSELSGDFRKVVMALVQSPMLPFNPTFHTAAKAEEEAIKLYKAGQGRLGTNEEVFIGIIAVSPPEFLRMMDAAYVRKYSNNIAKAVEKEFSGDAKRSLVHLVKSVMDPFPTIAEVFEKTMKGFGTDETGLSTALVRYHCVLLKVKEAYKKLYGKELRDRIYGETSGDYRRLLLEVYDAPQDQPVAKGAKTPAGASTGGPVPGPGGPGMQAPGGAVPLPGQPGYAAPQGTSAYPQPAGQAPGAHGAANPAYPVPAGYPPQQGHAPAPGYPPQQQQAAGGYPAAQPYGQPAPGYPPQQQTSAPGYPLQQQAPAPGYPPQQQAPALGYPSQQAPGYPPQQPAPGYPPQQQAPGYPQQAPAPGYPPPQQPPAQPYGYPPQQQPPAQPGYPTAQPGYAPQGQYPPAQPGYPPQQSGYPPQQYPPAQPGYPPAQPGYPPQQQYPPQGQYPPQYPPAQPGYPPQQQYPPQGQYPPTQGYPGYPPRGY